ncbi:hypothetical protein DOTSEDRAFT_169794 [Lecanosticta acicola]|uniref:DUF7165 domain-containing protein n=1 Tax=Lecanosticta acicola TaxID=111012 RepID=A0AAI8Z7V8_9PEZI|nr:hypothetical protein DOTSEDRAFT_169794 [Lecanosticta acicola]
MPVPTFSSHRSARQHSQLLSRWDDTRDRLHADERRRSMSQMQELDGTGLYERPDWPLPSPSPEERLRKRSPDDAPAEMEDRCVDQNAVLRKPEEIGAALNGSPYVEEADVSDVGEEDEEDVASPGVADNEEHPIPSSAPSRLQDQHRVDRTSELLDRISEQHRDPPRELASPPRQTHSEVSPARELPAPPALYDRESPDTARPRLIPRQRPEREHQPVVHAEINGHEEVAEEEEDEDEDDLEESRDIATPIPFRSDSPGYNYYQHPQGTNPSRSPPLLNGRTTPTPTTNGVNNRGSIAKGPMHTGLHRRPSTRSSWISTTQIPHNKDRVRYSWQSLQDDEPNRPRIHIIKLISNTATASAGCPTGEAFGFSISPSGRKIAAYNSARLYVLSTNALPMGISQDYALKRRPLAVELTDEGNTMAILADDHTVNIYDTGLQFRRTRTIELDFPTNCIALAPTGGLLAAAFEGGVEVFSLAASALPTDRRAVRSIKMDRLKFSDDGSTLLGTTTRINVSSTVVTSVPVFPADPNGVPTHEELKEAWCSELLHPENIRNSSHAVFLRENRADCNERLFAWNGLEDTFGILNVGDMQYGNIEFPVVISPPLSTCGGLGAAIHSCPSIDEYGDTIAMIVNDRTIRLYIVPHQVDEDTTTVEAHSIDHELDEGYGCPFSEARWVHSPSSLPAPLNDQTGAKGRLIVTSPGGVTEAGISEESVEDIEGGRIILFDFDPQFAGQPGQTFCLTLGKSPPQVLEEEQVDVQEQVALVRRRTVNQSKGGGLSSRPATLGRAATTYGGRALRIAGPAYGNVGASRNRNSMQLIGSMSSDAARSLPDLMENNEPADVSLEEPYAPGAPRSQASLQRAASNIQRHRFQTLEERQRERANSGSNGHFLPLPEYTEEPNAPLPSRYRAMAGLDNPAAMHPSKPAVATAPNGVLAGSSSLVVQTAPPDIGENFSAEQAFLAANARAAIVREQAMEQRPQSGGTQQSQLSTPTSATRPDAVNNFIPTLRGAGYESYTPEPGSGTFDSIDPAQGTLMFNAIPPPVRTGTVDSISSLPRSLQRAYSNAVSPMGTGPPPSLIGDWRNVSPIADPGSAAGSIRRGGGGGVAPPWSAGIREDEPWDAISPVQPEPSRPFGPPQGSPHRYSTSLLNPPGHMAPPRPPGSSSSYATSLSGTSEPSSFATGGRRMPPHMQAFRNAAAAQASASLFPPAVPPDHVPYRQNTTRAGTAAHPITAWHPPAAASVPPRPRTSGSTHASRSRRSVYEPPKSPGPTTPTPTLAPKAKKRGLFRKTRKHDPYAPSAYNEGQMEGSSSMMETKSVVTWLTKRDSKCVVM